MREPHAISLIRSGALRGTDFDQERFCTYPTLPSQRDYRRLTGLVCDGHHRIFVGVGHRIQGVSDELLPSTVDLDALGRVIAVHDGDPILITQKLAAQIGLAVGISAGANFIWRTYRSKSDGAAMTW